MQRAIRVARRVVRSFVLAGLLGTGCGGGSSTGPNGNGYFLRFTANGTNVEFTVQTSLVVAFGHASTQYNALITGFDATSNANVQLFDGAAIAKKTYSGYGITGQAFVGALLGYQDASGTVYTSGNLQTDAIVTVTDLTATTMSGTFEGRLKAAGKPDLVITNGEFFVKRAN